MIELLKQDIYSPISFEKQVAIIFAGSAGYLDKIDVKHVRKFEHDLLLALDREEKIITSIRESKDFSDETKKSLSEFLENFVRLFEEKK